MAITLVSQWNLDNGPLSNGGAASDSVGSVDLTAVSSNSIPAAAAGEVVPGAGPGLDFNSADPEYLLKTGSESTLLPSAGKTYAVEFNADSLGSVNALLSISDGSNTRIILQALSDGSVRVSCRISSTNYNVASTSTGVVAAGSEYQLIAVIPDPVGNPVVYVNGSAIATSSSVGPAADAGVSIAARYSSATPKNEYDGKIYRARVWDGAADTDEIASLWAQAQTAGLLNLSGSLDTSLSFDLSASLDGLWAPEILA